MPQDFARPSTRMNAIKECLGTLFFFKLLIFSKLGARISVHCTRQDRDGSKEVYFMANMNQAKSQAKIQKLVVLAILTALVSVLSYFGGFIKIGGLASISLTLIPIVFGSALYGPVAGAWLGAVSGVVFFTTADAVFWFGLNLPGTILTVLAKGILAGYSAGLVFKLLQKVNRYLAVFAAAIVCPVVNTGIFLVGCVLFFFDYVKDSSAANEMSTFAYLIVFFVGLNFVFELLVNIVVCPAIVRVIDVLKKNGLIKN